MEDRLSGVVQAFLLISRDGRVVGRVAPAPAAGRIGWDLKGRVVVLRLGGGSFCGGWRGSNGGRHRRPRRLCGLGSCSWTLRKDGRLSNLLLELSGRVVDSRVLACCARRDREELVEGQDAGLAAFPTWSAGVSITPCLSFLRLETMYPGGSCTRGIAASRRATPKVLRSLTYLSVPRGRPVGQGDTHTPPPGR